MKPLLLIETPTDVYGQSWRTRVVSVLADSWKETWGTLKRVLFFEIQLERALKLDWKDVLYTVALCSIGTKRPHCTFRVINKWSPWLFTGERTWNERTKTWIKKPHVTVPRCFSYKDLCEELKRWTDEASFIKRNPDGRLWTKFKDSGSLLFARFLEGDLRDRETSFCFWDTNWKSFKARLKRCFLHGCFVFDGDEETPLHV